MGAFPLFPCEHGPWRRPGKLGTLDDFRPIYNFLAGSKSSCVQAIIAQTLAIILKEAGLAAMAFEDPCDAAISAAETAPDLPISGVVKPAMTGVEPAIHFRTLHPECRVLLEAEPSLPITPVMIARRFPPRRRARPRDS
jgi:CheY-like chemotaxis protein